jgi:transcriptional regulator NrdR family protein
VVKAERGKLGPPCPFCHQHDSKVVDSRWHLQSMTKRRTRLCRCGEKFYTSETALHLKLRKYTTSCRKKSRDN